MALYIAISVLTVGLAFFIYREQSAGAAIVRQQAINRILLCAIFLVLFLVSALRIGIGNDYWTYRDQFKYIYGGDRATSFEIGFQWCVVLLQKLFGFDNYRVIFACIAFFTVFFFLIAIYELSDVFVISFFMFLANGFYFMSFSNMRYYLALSICVYAMKYVIKGDLVRFVGMVIVAALFHKTALVVIPFYLAARYIRWTRRTVWLIPAAVAALIAFRPLIRRIIFLFYPFYEGSAFDVVDISYVNILKCGAILIFSLLFYRKYISNVERAVFFFNLNLFSLMLYCFGAYIPELSRICYFGVIGQIFLLAYLYKSLSGTRWKYSFIPVLLAFLCYYGMFLVKGRDPYIMILPYLTWVFT